ncbi:MAG: sugar transferase [Iamia sp.]
MRSSTLDRLIGAGLCVLLAPMITGLAGWVRRADGPPAVIGLARAGRGGRPFRMWKLRTMHAAGEGEGASVTAGADPRVTRVGRRLRSLRLDELPQVLNVARGDMALIGPRPEACDLVDPDEPAWTKVLAVPPGVTGATQLVVHEWEERVIDGGGDHVARYRGTVLPVKLAIDRWYVRRASPLVDAVITWSMLERFALHREVTAIDRMVRREVPEAAAVDSVDGEVRR